MTDTGDVSDAVARALSLVEYLDEPWLYRYAAHAILDDKDTVKQMTLYSATGNELLVHDTENRKAYARGPFVAVRR